MKNRQMARLVIFFTCTILVSTIILNLFLHTNTVNGSSIPPIKSYMTVSVKPHDTLWDLASRYMNADYYDHESYISEVISINNISNATILSGQVLTLPVLE